ncbi:GGDEF domain-containing protein [Sphingomonas sp. A2-49]|uniref:GGDEF domain-containing protein n=1 Tax=Sphingomonas sp. A2-49 TaxID=1391375 RepID=UPI0021D137F0|nr:GGDEF domain-containing protein [Sphingomonas sp. A2-49]MCU6455750.1 GGDEF domain-containing protein [Sphingomonas sp. A2-49]
MPIRLPIRHGVALLLLMLAWIGASPAAAAPDVGIATCILRAPPGPQPSPAALFADPHRFDCATRQTDFGAGDYWILSHPLPRGIGTDTRVRQASLWQDRLTLYVLYADGAIRSTGFSSADAGRYLRLGAILQLAPPAHDARPVRLLWHIEGAINRRGILVSPTLTDSHSAARAELTMAALYAAFAGMCLALLVYNLALWAALRQAFQPAYCLMVVCLLAYASTSSGLLGQVTAIDNNYRQRLNYVLLAWAAAAAIVFARAFLERRVFDGWLRPYSTAVLLLLLSTTGAYGLLAPRFAAVTDTASTLAYIAVLTLLVPVLVRAWLRRSNYLWVFALAWGAPVALASVRVLAALNFIGWQMWIDNSTLLAMALEAALSSLGVAYRIRLLSLERDAAREQEIAARLLAATDPLTGLLNRRAFLDGTIGRAEDHQLILVDIDHFKTINETIGHDGGDEVLRVIARALRAAARPDVLVARIGGEEFALLARADAPIDARLVLDRLRMERMPFDLTVTASIGTCIGPLTRETDWKALYRCADRALFAAKAAGRDRVRNAADLAHAA